MIRGKTASASTLRTRNSFQIVRRVVAYLVCTHQMDHDEDIGTINEPVGVVEAKASQQVAWCIVTKGTISN